MDNFDATAFRLPRPEAVALDPQARLLLEHSWVRTLLSPMHRMHYMLMLVLLEPLDETITTCKKMHTLHSCFGWPLWRTALVFAAPGTTASWRSFPPPELCLSLQKHV